MKPESSACSSGGRAPTASRRRGSAERRPPASTTRSPTSSSPAVGAHAGDVRRAVVPPRGERLDGDAAADLDAGLRLRRAGEDPLDDGAARGDRREALVARAGRAVGDRRGHPAERVELQGPRGGQRRADVGEALLEDLPAARLDVVRLAELRDAAALPRRQGLVERVRNGRRVALEDGHVMAVPLEEQRPAQADHATTDHHDAGHGSPPPFIADPRSCSVGRRPHADTSGGVAMSSRPSSRPSA